MNKYNYYTIVDVVTKLLCNIKKPLKLISSSTQTDKQIENYTIETQTEFDNNDFSK